MKINEAEGRVTFDRLVHANRSLGSEEAITMPKPAVKAAAANAKGMFARRSLEQINSSAEAAAGRLKEALLAS